MEGALNDLWKFNPTTWEWTWMGGSPTTGNAPGTYGNLGAANNSNFPGGRSGAISWVDSSGNFWLFGGTGIAANAGQTGSLNDLWKFNPTTLQWTWIAGTNLIDQPGIYGTKNIGSIEV